jgi:hypothetical protein
MNRNIVTKANAKDHAKLLDDFLRAEVKGPSGPTSEQLRQLAETKPDQWYDRLLKYIPVEAISLYLAVEGIMKSASLPRQQLRMYLLLMLLITIVFDQPPAVYRRD